MLTLNDGRSELWQWDTGRKLTVDADCSQVHFSNKVFGRSTDVDVVDGVATIPDVLLQTDKDLTAWAFVGTAEDGHTKISKVFKVNKRNKPADYVFTPPEQTTLEEIKEKLDYLESIQDPDAIKNAVDEYLTNNPVQIKETDPTVSTWAKQPTKPTYTAKEIGAVATVNGVSPDENGNVEITIPDSGGNANLTAEQIAALDGMFKVCGFIKDDVSAEYNAFKTAFGITDSGGGEVEPEEPDVPVIPDEPDEPEDGVSNETTWADGVAYSGITWEEDKYLNATTGEVKTDDGWGLTQYLYCEGAAKINIQNTYRKTGNYSGFFDTNKVWVSAFCGTQPNIDVPVPENAAYFRLSTDMTGVVTITPYASA